MVKTALNHTEFLSIFFPPPLLPPLSFLGKVGFLLNSYFLTSGEVECRCAALHVKSHVVKLLRYSICHISCTLHSVYS